jgi:hypothetical protein
MSLGTSNAYPSWCLRLLPLEQPQVTTVGSGDYVGIVDLCVAVDNLAYGLMNACMASIFQTGTLVYVRDDTIAEEVAGVLFDGNVAYPLS